MAMVSNTSGSIGSERSGDGRKNNTAPSAAATRGSAIISPPRIAPSNRPTTSAKPAKPVARPF